MPQYKNLDGDSGVDSYEISDDSITVTFRSGKERHYLFTHQEPGVAMVEKMKTLAIQGEGLNSYIKTVVKKQYAKKW